MKDYTQFFERFEECNPIPFLYEEGLTHSQIEEFIVIMFKPYFKNQNFFKETPIDLYLETWINFIAFKTREQFEFTVKVLKLYNDAYSIDSKYTLETMFDYGDDFLEGLSKFWTFLNSEKKQKDFFDVEDYHNYILQSIGLVIEGASKPLLKELFQLNKLIKGDKLSKEKVDDYDLGILVDFLEHNDFQKLLRPKPMNIRVSQLRNMSYHHNASLQKNGVVKCSYGKGDKKIEFESTLSDLELTLQNVLCYYNSIKLAREIFQWDNYKEVKSLRAHIKEDPKLRPEAMAASMHMVISRGQFKMVSLKTNDDNAYLVVQDLLIGEEDDRAVYSSQFLYNLWWYTDKDNLQVEYKDKNGKTRLISKTTADVCSKIGKGKQTLAFMAKNVVLETFN